MALGPLYISTHGLAFLTAAFLFRWLCRRQLSENERILLDQAVPFMVFGSGLGARFVYLMIHPETWLHPGMWIQFWEGGMVSYGGLGGALLALVLFRRWKNLPQMPLFNQIAPYLLISWGVGRIGCFFTWHGEEGTIANVPWAVEVGTETFHPTTLYLSLAFFLGGLLLTGLDASIHPVALYSLAYYSIVRGILDNLRIYYPPELRQLSQATCAALFLCSVTLIMLLKKNSRTGR